ncbi:unnamed protein product, partial [marine sediment metagenome]
TVEVTFVAEDGTPATANLNQGDNITFEPETFAITNNGSAPADVNINGVTYTISPNEVLFYISIDIKPGSEPNSINLGAKGVVPVAVLTTEVFDASTIEPSTVTFAGAAPVRWVFEDVNNDGDLDLLFHFKTQELNLTDSSTSAALTGQTTDGDNFVGSDPVNIVPKKNKNKK